MLGFYPQSLSPQLWGVGRQHSTVWHTCQRKCTHLIWSGSKDRRRSGPQHCQEDTPHAQRTSSRLCLLSPTTSKVSHTWTFGRTSQIQTIAWTNKLIKIRLWGQKYSILKNLQCLVHKNVRKQLRKIPAGEDWGRSISASKLCPLMAAHLRLSEREHSTAIAINTITVECKAVRVEE